jgi:hypothetical protein
MPNARQLNRHYFRFLVSAWPLVKALATQLLQCFTTSFTVQPVEMLVHFLQRGRTSYFCSSSPIKTMEKLLQRCIEPNDPNVARLAIGLEQGANGKLNLSLCSWLHCSFNSANFKLEEFLESVRLSNVNTDLILYGPITDDQDEHRSIRQALEAFGDQGKLISLECSLVPNCVTELIQKSKQLRTLKLCLNGSIGHDFRELTRCLEQHPSLESFSLLTSFDYDFNRVVRQIPGNQEMFDMLGAALVSTPKLTEVKLRVNGQDAGRPAWRCPFSVHILKSLLERRTSLLFLSLTRCRFSEDQSRVLATGLASAQSLEKLTLLSCELGNDSYQKIISSLGKARTMKTLELQLRTPTSIAVGLSLYDLLVEQNTLQSLALTYRSYYSLVDNASYAITKGLFRNTSLRHLRLQCYCMETTGYKTFEDALTTHLCRKQPQCNDTCCSSTDGPSVDMANASVASTLLSALKTNQELESLNISQSSSLTTHGFRAFIGGLSKNRGLRVVNIKELSIKTCGWCSEMTNNGITQLKSKMALQLAVHCTSLEKIIRDVCIPSISERYTEDDSKLWAEVVEDQWVVDAYLRLHRVGRESILGSCKEQAVEVLIDFRNELSCLVEILLLNPALFFSP